MILDNWLSGNLRILTEQDASKALDELNEVAEGIEKLTREGKYWEAYTRLTACITFLNISFQQQRTQQPRIIQRLLNWIQNIKGTIDKVVQGIGGSGYSIGVSLPFGASISVSFTV